MAIEDVDFTTSDYIEVFAPDGSYVSRHRVPDEAREAAFEHAKQNQETLGEGSHEYLIKPPETRMTLVVMGDGVGRPQDTTAPAAPTGLAVSSTSSSSLTLDWDDNSDSDLSHFDVYYSAVSGGGPWTKANTVDVTSSTYVISGLSASTQYWVYVTAVDTSDNESSASNVDSATTEAPGIWPKLAWNDVGVAGPFSGVGLPAYSGPLTISTPDTTIQNQTIGFLNVRADRATIRGCYFRNNPSTAYLLRLDDLFAFGYGDHLIEDCTFEGGGSAMSLVGGRAGTTITFRNCQFRDSLADNIKLYSSATILFESCYFGPCGVTGDSAHVDAMQSAGANGTITYRGCTFDGKPPNTEALDSNYMLAQSGYSGFYSQGFGLFADEDNGLSGILNVEYCHFDGQANACVRIGAQDAGPVIVNRFTVNMLGNKCYLGVGTNNVFSNLSNTAKTQGEHGQGYLGVFVDQGGNEWAETGTILGGASVTAGQAISISTAGYTVS